jgi:hypothetical protein
MGEPERVPEREFEEEAERPVEMKVRRMPEEELEEAPAARPARWRRYGEQNPSVAIAFAAMAAAVLSVASIAIWAPMELGFVMPWLLGSLTVLGIGLGVTSTIRCRRE